MIRWLRSVRGKLTSGMNSGEVGGSAVDSGGGKVADEVQRAMVVLVVSSMAANSSRNGGEVRLDVLHSGDTPESNCGCPGDLRMGKTGEEGLYNMGKRLGTKGGLGGDEFELLLSSNGGALARDWSSLAAQKARVSWGKIEGGLGVFIGYFFGKRATKSGDFGEIGSGQKVYARRKLPGGR
jgi:hypothetical protein